MGFLSRKSVGIDLGSEQPTYAEATKTLWRVDSLQTRFLRIPGETPASDHDGGGSDAPAEQENHTADGPWAPSTADEVIVGLPRRCFVLRFLDLPDLDEHELKDLVAYELERHLPFPADKAWYGFQKMTRHDGKARVMLVAAKQEEIESQLKRIAEWGLQPTAVYVSSFATLSVFLRDHRSPRGGIRTLISVHGDEAVISTVENGALLSSRSMALMNGSLDPILSELKRISSVVAGGPGTVFLNGECDGLALRAKEALDIETESWSPRWPSAENPAIGLALCGLGKNTVSVNLLPPERRRKRRDRAVSVLIGALSLAALLGGGLLLASVLQERWTLEELNRRVAEIREESATLSVLRRDTGQLETKLRLINGLLEEQERPLVVLNALAQILPPAVSLNEVSIQNDKVRVGGSTSSSASDLIGLLERSAAFQNASFASSISPHGQDRQGFQIQASIKSRLPELNRDLKPNGGEVRK